MRVVELVNIYVYVLHVDTNPFGMKFAKMFEGLGSLIIKE
jgi:hypothetical protein